MPKAKTELTRKVLKINADHQDMLDVFTGKWGFISESEVLRQALTFFYRKYEPAYLQPSVSAKIKQKKLTREEELEQMSPEEYCTDTVKGWIVTSDDGIPYCIYHGWANDPRVLRVDDAKDFFIKNPDYLENHLSKLQSRPVQDLITNFYVNQLYDDYKIKIEVEEEK